jgi:hypothetical protein
MNEAELLAEIWYTLKEYIKDKQQAIDHLISTLVDSGLTDETVEELRGIDKYLDKALEEYAYIDDDIENYYNDNN